MVVKWVFGVLHNFSMCLFIAVSTICSRYVVTTRNRFTIGLARNLVQFSIVQPSIVFINEPYFGVNNEKKFIFLSAFLEGCFLILNIAALSFITATETMAISLSYPAILSVTRHFFSKDKFEKRFLVTSSLTIIGTLLTTQPEFMFPSDTSHSGIVSNRYLGYFLAVLASFCLAGVCLSTERIARSSPWVSASVSSLLPIPINVAGLFLAKDDFRDYPLCGIESFLVIVSAITYQIGIVEYFASYQCSPDSRLWSVIGACQIPIIYILEIFILGVNASLTRFVGVGIVSLSSVLSVIFRLRR